MPHPWLPLLLTDLICFVELKRNKHDDDDVGRIFLKSHGFDINLSKTDKCIEVILTQLKIIS